MLPSYLVSPITWFAAGRAPPDGECAYRPQAHAEVPFCAAVLSATVVVLTRHSAPERVALHALHSGRSLVACFIAAPGTSEGVDREPQAGSLNRIGTNAELSFAVLKQCDLQLWRDCHRMTRPPYA